MRASSNPTQYFEEVRWCERQTSKYKNYFQELFQVFFIYHWQDRKNREQISKDDMKGNWNIFETHHAFLKISTAFSLFERSSRIFLKIQKKTITSLPIFSLSGISKAKLSLKTGASVHGLTAVFLFSSFSPDWTSHSLTYGSEPVANK